MDLDRRPSIRTKVAMGVAALTLGLAQLACGGAPKIDPCDEAFQALTTAFSETTLGEGNMSESMIDINPSIPGVSTHPNDIIFGGRHKGWSDVVMYLDLNCKDKYSVNYAGSGLNRFSEGVSVRRKQHQDISLPENSQNWVTASVLAIATLLGLSTLGLGVKKLVRA